jgi:mTERF domain-containing protein
MVENCIEVNMPKIAHSTLPSKIAKPSLAVAGDMLRLSCCRPTAGGGLAGAMLHLLPLLRARAATHLPTSSLDLSRRRRLLLSTAARSAAATPFSVEEYLVDTCGLTGAQALKASKKLSHLRSPAKPDAVLAVLSGVGLSRADLAAVVAAEPQLLCARADNIARRIASLRDRVGLSDPQIGSFLLVAGGAKGIHACDVAPRLEFWIPFLGSFEMLLKILKGNNVLVLSDLEKVIKPNIALLQECGLTVCDIAKMARFAPRMFTSNPKQVEGFVRRADELGVPRTSGQFKYMVGIFANISEGSATARMEYLSRSLGCSMDKLRSAVQKLPQILGLSETNLGSKIEFLVGKVRLEPEYLLKTPKLFTYSLEKRLVARHYIVQVLAAKGLKGLKKDVPFCSYVQLGESCFVKNFIDQHENVVPGLSDAYAALRAGKVPPEVQH